MSVVGIGDAALFHTNGGKVGEGLVGTFEVGRVAVVLLLGLVALVVLQASTTWGEVNG